jgi:hypothetical protein
MHASGTVTRFFCTGLIFVSMLAQVVLHHKDGRHRTLLHLAAMGNASNVVRHVFETIMRGASAAERAEALNACDDENATPLMLAVEQAAQDSALVRACVCACVHARDRALCVRALPLPGRGAQRSLPWFHPSSRTLTAMVLARCAN